MMMALVVAAVLVVCGSAVVDDEARPRVGGLVCRRCGMELVSGPADVLAVASGAAVGAYRAALFGNETTTDARGRGEEAGEDHDDEEEEEDKGKQLVQHFVNPEGHTFEVITARWKDLYMHTDQAFSQDSWFEGYAWKFAHCQRCGTQVGWIFVPEGPLEDEHDHDAGMLGGFGAAQEDFVGLSLHSLNTAQGFVQDKSTLVQDGSLTRQNHSRTRAWM